MARVSVKVREGPRVTRRRFDSLDTALAYAREAVGELAGKAAGRPVNALMRSYEPVEQVAARVELTVPQARFCGALRAGVDVRGDGSIEAYRGGLQRQLIEPVPGEDEYGALRRALGG